MSEQDERVFYNMGRRGEQIPSPVTLACARAWANGVWDRQAERMPKPDRVERPRPSKRKR